MTNLGSVLWQGVHAILAADPSLQDSMLELLQPHFTLFLQAEGPLLKLDACTSLQVTVCASTTVLLHAHVIRRIEYSARFTADDACLLSLACQSDMGHVILSCCHDLRHMHRLSRPPW